MTSRGTYRGLYSALFDDPDFQRLSPRARHVLLTARLCSQNTAASLFGCYLEVLAAQTGLSAEEVEAALRELANQKWIVREGRVVWIRNGLKFDPNTKLSNEKHRLAVARALQPFGKMPIVAKYRKYYGLEGLSDGSRRASHIAPQKAREDPAQLGPPSPSTSPSPSPNTKASTDAGGDTGFSLFWAAYPMRIGREAALKVWRERRLEPKTQEILAGLERTRGYLTREGSRFVPNPATWLAAGRWQDEPPPSTPFSPKTAANA